MLPSRSNVFKVKKLMLLLIRLTELVLYPSLNLVSRKSHTSEAEILVPDFDLLANSANCFQTLP